MERADTRASTRSRGNRACSASLPPRPSDDGWTRGVSERGGVDLAIALFGIEQRAD